MPKKYTLLTGGLGFIGSHTAFELSQQGKPIILVDNLSNSNLDVFFKIQRLATCDVIFYQTDILDTDKIQDIFTKHDIDSVIHFAAYKAVNESLQKPLEYYHNNITGLITILNLCLKNNVNHFVFSSSATVYGNAIAPLIETSPVGTGITSPYGQSKYMAETILQDVCNAHPLFQCTCLRYFNPVGAHPSGLLGENPNGIPTNLMPYIIRVAAKHNNLVDLGEAYRELSIFGGDYQTHDGTCIRDFIHVCDLAKAHVCSLRETQGGYQVYNVGTGVGTSVLELVETFQQVNQVKVPFTIKERREGDRDIVYCDASKIESALGWTPEKSLKDICKDAWNFVKSI
jgi:UDP-glucose 4-epimerase